MRDNQTKVALNWVKDEVESTLEQAQNAIKAYAEDESDKTQIHFCANCMHQIRGTMQMLEFSGAALLAEEMEALAEAIGERKVESNEKAYEVFLSAILRFRSYLSRYAEGKSDLPVILLPAINDMRICRGADNLGAGNLISIPTEGIDAPSPKNKTELKGDILAEVKALRSKFQQGLLGVIRDVEVQANMEQMREVTESLWGLENRVPYQPLWWVASTFLKNIGLLPKKDNPVVKSLLGQVDRRIRELIEQTANQEEANKVLINILFYVAQFDTEDEQVKEVQDKFQLNQLMDSLGDLESESSDLTGPDTASVRIALNVIKEDLGEIKESLDLYIRTKSQESEPLEDMIPAMQKISDTMSMLGLTQSKEMISKQMGSIGDLLDGSEADREQGLIYIAEGILSLEDYIERALKMDSKQLANESLGQGEGESLQIINARYQLVQESRGNLHKVKDAITDYLDESHNINRLENVPELLKEVEGALTFAQLDTLLDVITKSKNFVVKYLISEKVVLSDAEVSTLADAISSVDYYLEGLMSSGLHGLPVILQRAIDSISELEEHYGNLDEELLPVLDEPLEMPEIEMVESENHDQDDDSDELIDDEVREIFIEEADEVLEEMHSLLPEWKQDQTNKEAINTIRRNFHTLKGSGRMVGATDIGELSWAIENMLNRLLDHSIEYSPALFVTTEEVANILPKMVKQFAGGERTQYPRDLAERANRISKGEIITDIQPHQEQTEEEADQAAEQELFDIFKQEAEGHVTNLEMFANQRQQGITQSQISDNLLRSLHTLKGVAHIANIQSLTNVIVPVESYFQELKTRELLAEEGDMALIDHTKDLLRYIISTPEDDQVISVHEDEILQQLSKQQKRFDESGETIQEQGRDPELIKDIFNIASDVLVDIESTNLQETPEKERLEKISYLMASVDRLKSILGEAELNEIEQVVSALSDALQRNMTASKVDTSIGVLLNETYNQLENQFDCLAANLSITEASDLVQALQTWSPAEATAGLELELEPATGEAAAKDESSSEVESGLESSDETSAAIPAEESSEPEEKQATEDNSIEFSLDDDFLTTKPEDKQEEKDTSFEEKATSDDNSIEFEFSDDFLASEPAEEESSTEEIEDDSDISLEDAAEELGLDLSEDLDLSDELDSDETSEVTEETSHEEVQQKETAGEDSLEYNFEELDETAETTETTEDVVSKQEEPLEADELADQDEAATTEEKTGEIIEEAPEEETSQAVEEEPRKESAKTISLDLDVDDELLEIFSEEAEELFDSDAALLQKWRQEPNNVKIIAELQRNLHTLKGSARMAGFSPIGDLAHGLEDLYTAITDQLFAASDQAIDLAERAEDQLLAIFNARNTPDQIPSPAAMLDEIQGFISAQKAGRAYVRPQAEDIKPTEIVEEPQQPVEEAKTESPKEENKAEEPEQIKTEEPTQDKGALEEAAWNEELAELFLGEASELLSSYEEAIERWSGDLHNTQPLNSAMRNLHTLKSGAKLAAITPIGELTHKLEGLVEALARDPRLGNSRWADVLRRSYDQLHEMVEQVRNGHMPEKPAELLRKLESDKATIESQLDQLDKRDLAESGEQAEVKVVSLADRQKQKEEAAKEAANRDVIRVRSEVLDNLVNLSGEASIFRSRLEQQVADLNFNLKEMSSTVDRLREQLRNLEIETEAQVLYRREISGVDFDEFDPLEMDRYTRQQELTRSLLEAASDLMSIQETLETKVGDAEATLLAQGRVNTELQDRLMRTRMVPFNSIESRLRRMVRQISTELNKDVDLILESEGEMDRTVIERMVAPLDHMLRNAIDHGIESKTERKKAGKVEKGTVHLSLSRRGNEVYIQIQDDGAGIRKDKVRARAISQGMIDESYNPTDRELFRLILQPGFSTAETVTQISGRGVGMDVVHSEILQLGGSLNISSEEGQGTTMTVRLPFTLSSNQALMVRVKGEPYAIPLSNITTVARVSAKEVLEIYQDKDKTFSHLGEEFELRYLGQILDRNSDIIPPVDEYVPVLIIQGEDKPIAVHVDELIGSREIVVKNIGRQISTVPGISGASILGDGSVVLILDMQTLVDRFHEWDFAHEAGMVQEAPVENRIPIVMVVDDSITVRKVTARLLQRNQFQVMTAKDGVDAITQLHDDIPDVMLLDIEMPRMDGFELATIIRHDERLKHLPIIMITSRTGEKHRERAEQIGVNRYLGKPYNEEALLGTIDEMLKLED
ncbi:Hpt domain-containing protein [Kangiella koreensis]|uniref:Chemotaxis protein CheA n=1 Tax=Kangiella koreensis (strain DSM 16069 / JCM 12317 / KCTC 12182 / SW-125) TaxID=523791 RepID=C7R7A2_KANKD|nr:Hpt domain-containing protein [Kangiella koreensis]ACV25651.1 CheA signal transduction histidine kinase [Kangiella koreensis DSM 16069]